jgi:hypothetical protein
MSKYNTISNFLFNNYTCPIARDLWSKFREIDCNDLVNDMKNTTYSRASIIPAPIATAF